MQVPRLRPGVNEVRPPAPLRSVPYSGRVRRGRNSEIFAVFICLGRHRRLRGGGATAGAQPISSASDVTSSGSMNLYRVSSSARLMPRLAAAAPRLSA